MPGLLLYTIGHSTHTHAHFLELLRAHKVNCLADVRSVAASAHNPQYNKAALKSFLNGKGIQYLHMGVEFGARQASPLRADGRLDVEKFKRSAQFQSGVERLRAGIEKKYTIALMCAEADPLQCHRFHMISKYLAVNGFEVRHILKDGTCVTQAVVEAHLAPTQPLAEQGSLFHF